MRKNITIISLLLFVAFLTVSCGEKVVEMPSAETSVEESVKEEPVEEATVAESVEEVEEKAEPAEKTEAKEEKEEEVVYYTDKFEKVEDYSKYGESGDAKSGDMIWVEGTIDEYDEAGNRLVLTSDLGKWSVSTGADGSEFYYDLVKEAVGKTVRVFGKYTGYSKENEMPGIAYLPKEYQPFAYRLESVDNSFRITQLDYHFVKPEYDTERTYGRLTYKEPEVWEDKYSDDTLLYYFSDDMPAVVMVHSQALADAGFDEINKDDLLSDLADSYVKDEGEIIRKTPFKLSGYPALCFENTWSDEALPVSMSLFCYMFIVDDEYYYFGCGEPFLVGEACKRILPDLLKDFKVGDGNAVLNSVAKADEKKEETKKTEDKETAKDIQKTEEAPKTEETTKEETQLTAETQKAEELEPAAAAPAPTVKTGHPKKDDLFGKIFTMVGNITLTGTADPSQVYSGTETLPDFLFTQDMVDAYNEDTGVYTLSMNDGGQQMVFTMTFTYNADGKIVYSGPVSVVAQEYTGTGTVSGSER